MVDSQVQKIKDKLSINEVVGQYVTLRRAGRNFVAPCPFHKERTPSFHVSPERGSYMCFGCGEKGDIFSFVQKMEGVDFVTALKQLAKQAGVVLTQRQFTGHTDEDKKKEERLLEVCDASTAFFESILKNKKEIQTYLHTRGVHDETTAAWRLGYAPASWRELSEHLASLGFTKDEMFEAGLVARSDKKVGEVYDRFRGRIMFPLFDASGKVIAFSGRFFEKVPGSHEEGEPAKYVNSPETALFKKSRVLYGYDRAKNFIRKADCILLVEGQFDLVLAHQSGLPFTVAVSGTALTQEHLSLLGRLSHRLILALDGDTAGVRAGLKSSAMALAMGFDVKIPTFEGGKDPADLARENPELLKAAVRTSKPAIEFFLETLRRSAKDQRSFKTAVQLQLFPLVQAIPGLVAKAHVISILSQWLDMQESDIRTEVAKARSALVDTGTEVVVPEPVAEQPLTVLERSVGMLLFGREDDSALQSKLEELLGKERLQKFTETLRPWAEKLRFEFDTIEEGSLRAEGLMQTIEKTVIDEEMKEVKQKLYGGGGEAAALVEQLASLKRREQQLRK